MNSADVCEYLTLSIRELNLLMELEEQGISSIPAVYSVKIWQVKKLLDELRTKLVGEINNEQI